MAEPSVRMSGIVLASLMFQHVNSDSDVEGLILGESKFEEQVTISDSQADHIYIEEIYNIHQHVPCHRPGSFYNSVGDVDLDGVKKMLADNKQKESVIGWYKQRRNTEQQMSFREKLIHVKLKGALSNPHLIFVLLTPSKVTTPGSTHRMEYTAFISRSGLFLKVPVVVNNLGLLEQLSYWKVPSPCSAAGYNLTMKKHSSSFFSSNGLLREVGEVIKMNDSLQSELEKACRRVEESERLIETLQADVSALKRQLSEKKQNGAASDEGPPEQKNAILHTAIRNLFAHEPLFHTQTLNLKGHPVPENCFCCTENNAEGSAMGLENTDTAEDPESLSLLSPYRTKPQKRLRGGDIGRGTKRRKNCS